MGELTGLDGIRPVRELELRPYFAARAVHSAPAPAAISSPGRLDACPSIGLTPNGLSATCVGLDLRYGLTSDLQLIASVNPDFGQVEADQLVLNLTTFETFFPEKRPFFLEGLDIFQPPVRADFGGAYGKDAFQLFYSRRIGRPPTLPDPLPDGTQLLYSPAARPVAEALKVVGSVGDATVALLSSVEPRVSAQLYGPDHKVAEQQLAAAVHSAAGRVRVPVGANGLFGVTATAVDPLFASGERHAHAGGADLVLFDHQRDWNIQTQVAGSFLTGGVPEVERDGTVLGDGSSGAAASFKLAKEGGPVTWFAQADYLTPQFTTNDLGFMRRANLARLVSFMNLRAVHPNDLWQSARLGFGGRTVRNAALDVPLETDFGFEGNVTLNNFWYWGGGLYASMPGFDDRELLDGTPFERPATSLAYGFIGSDSRKAVSGELDWTWLRGLNRFYDQWNPSATLRFRPMPQLDTQLDVGVVITRGDIRSIRAATTPAGSGADPTVTLDPATATAHERVYLFAPQDSRSVSATLRGTYAFSPTLTLQAYAQLFTAGIAYHAPLRYQAAPGRERVHLADLTPALPEDQAPDLDDRQAGLNVNLILRWEWSLGSTLYLVYAHATSTDFTPPARGLDFGRELSAVGQPGATHGDTLMVKVDLLKAL
jgi:hypothetical protein